MLILGLQFRADASRIAEVEAVISGPGSLVRPAVWGSAAELIPAILPPFADRARGAMRGSAGRPRDGMGAYRAICTGASVERDTQSAQRRAERWP